jgi:hypothetical protein
LNKKNQLSFENLNKCIKDTKYKGFGKATYDKLEEIGEIPE